MKKHSLKIMVFICVFCMAISCGTLAYAIDKPEISVTVDKTRRNAEISLEDLSVTIYSAQITFDIEGKGYAVEPSIRNAAAEVLADGDDVTVYIASSEVLNGEGDSSVKLAQLSSSSDMTIGNRASKVVLVDRFKQPVEYENVTVNVTYEKNESSSTTRPGGTGSGGSGESSISRPTTRPGSTTTPETSEFTDVAGHWAAESITYVKNKGLFSGTSSTTFEPNTNMTRAMYVTVLKRFGTAIDEKWNISCDNPKQFVDIEEGTWYADAVAWAGGIGVVNGIGDDKFGPDIAVTREQIAVMTVKFAQLAGVSLPDVNEAATFTDADTISPWAADAVNAAQRAGLIYGRDKGNFAPQDTATRAEVAAILQRFAEMTK